jgi:ferredoxin-type protein NapG
MSLVGLVMGLYSEVGQTRPPHVLRPPGARADEEEFLGLCVRCGLCVRACPYDCLRLAEFGDPIAAGTPFFIASEYPCYMCPDIPCVKACPTGALDPELTDIKDARMGLARVVGTDRCLNYWFNHRCLACSTICPVRGKAITLEKEIWVKRNGEKQERFIPTVHDEHCTGCGMCEKNCPTARYAGGASIKVLPLTFAKQEDQRYHRRLATDEEKAPVVKSKERSL